MAAATSFFATATDEAMLLDYLGEPTSVQLFDWWAGTGQPLNRRECLKYRSIGILAIHMGSAQWLTPKDPGFESDNLTSDLLRINWHNRPGRPLLDADTTPALLWTRGETSPPVLTPSDIGSQASALSRMPDEYRRLVNRVSAWVRRNGNPVWDCSNPRSPVALGDVQLNTVSTVYALPDATAALENGCSARSVVP